MWPHQGIAWAVAMRPDQGLGHCCAATLRPRQGTAIAVQPNLGPGRARLLPHGQIAPCPPPPPIPRAGLLPHARPMQPDYVGCSARPDQASCSSPMQPNGPRLFLIPAFQMWTPPCLLHMLGWAHWPDPACRGKNVEHH